MTGIRDAGQKVMSIACEYEPCESTHYNRMRILKMKPIVRAALSAWLLGSTAAVLMMGSALAEDKLSREVAKPMADAQKALQATPPDFATALMDVKLAQAVTDRTPYEDYVINSYLAQIYIQQKDYASADGPLEAAADSPAIPEDQKKATYSNAFQLAMFAKHYTKGIEYGQKLLAMNALDYKGEANLALAYYFTQDTAHAQQYAQMAIDGAKAAGQTPDENMLKIVMNSALQQKDSASVQSSLESLALQYNQADSWSKLVDLALGTKGIRDADELFLLRLKVLIPNAMNSEDYLGLASVANLGGYATEAYNVLQKGIAAGKVTAAQGGPTYTQARSGAATDARELNSIASQAEHSKTGEADIKLAEDYWGYGRFADAEAAARRAMSKGGLKDPNEGPMLLGMLLAAQGKYADAQQTLAGVNGSAARKATAHLWSVYAQAQLKAQGASAQSTPPAH